MRFLLLLGASALICASQLKAQDQLLSKDYEAQDIQSAVFSLTGHNGSLFSLKLSHLDQDRVNKAELDGVASHIVQEAVVQKVTDVSSDVPGGVEIGSEISPSPVDSAMERENMDTSKDKQSLVWFVGGSVGTQIGLKYKGEATRFLNLVLDGGLFYYVGLAHGIKGFVSASYNTLGTREYFSAGGGIDYFYDFQTLNVGVFLGVYADMPIGTSLLKGVDVIANIGATYSINAQNRVDVRCGYPLMQDPSLKRTLTVLVSYQYLFKTK